jgi:hypothetical protein
MFGASTLFGQHLTVVAALRVIVNAQTVRSFPVVRDTRFNDERLFL